ncbi:MAG: TetR/AcrR family transcriptional regulator [Myxococcota bacterium]
MKADPAQRRSQAQRRRETKRRLIDAVVRCLDEIGYAQTTLATVQQAAGVSRGALLHHFPSKQVLLAATAESILGSALEVARTDRPQRGASSIEAQLVDYWRTVANTARGRAYVEILSACRTDSELREAVADVVADWEPGLTLAALERFIGRRFAEEPEDVKTLWRICNAFLRGLLLDPALRPERAEQQIRLFAKVLVSHHHVVDDGRDPPPEG